MAQHPPSKHASSFGHSSMSTDGGFQFLIEQVDCGIAIYLIDEQGSALLHAFNSVFATIVGLSASDLKSAAAEDLRFHVTDEYFDAVGEAFLKAAGCDDRVCITYLGRRADGERRWAELTLHRAEYAPGKTSLFATLYDVDDAVRANERLTKSEQSLEVATRGAGVWYWEYDWKNNTAYPGRSMQEFLGFPPVLENFPETWLRDNERFKGDYEELLSKLQEIKNGAERVSMDARFMHTDGTLHWVRLQLFNLFDDAGNAIEAAGIIQLSDDYHRIKDRFAIEEKRSNIDLEGLLAHTLFNLTTNTTMKIVGDNVLGDYDCTMTLQQLHDLVLEKIIHIDNREAFDNLHDRDYLMHYFEQGQRELSVEFRLRMPDGLGKWVRTTAHLTHDPDENDILLFLRCYDINIEKSLGIMMNFAVNDDYDLVGEVSFSDGFAVMMFGPNSYNPHETNRVEEDYQTSLIRFALNAVDKEEREEYLKRADLAHIQQVLATQVTYEFFTHSYNDNGQLRTKKVRYTRWSKDPDICLFTQTDVTDLLAEEQQKQDRLLAALDQAEVASNAKTDFLSNMSHEIRTPMNAIIGMTKLARDVEGNPEDTMHYLEKIDSSSQYLLGILNDVLDMSRIESGKLDLHPEWISPYAVLDSCVTMMDETMRERRLNFHHPPLNASAPVQYYVDPLRLRQILMNLLNNAAKFTPEGGTVSMEVSHVDRNGSSVVDEIIISDTGCGMSREFLERAFEPFEQETNRFSNTVKGTGLGLALVKRFAEAMGGGVSVESVLGEGSTFTVRLETKCRLLKLNNNAAETPITHTSLKGRRVLLTDDHPLNREIGEILLQKRGILVESAENGRIAVDLFNASEEGYFDALLMDVRMPVMDGLEATRTIRSLARKDAATVPIIAMTANAFDEDIHETLDAGMSAHLTKPVDPDVLYGTLEKFLA